MEVQLEETDENLSNGKGEGVERKKKEESLEKDQEEEEEEENGGKEREPETSEASATAPKKPKELIEVGENEAFLLGEKPVADMQDAESTGSTLLEEENLTDEDVESLPDSSHFSPTAQVHSIIDQLTEMEESDSLRDKKASLPLNLVASAVQRILAKRGSPVLDTLSIQLILLAACMDQAVPAGKEIGTLTVTNSNLEVFFSRFGPIEEALHKARAALFESAGKIRPEFWGTMSRPKAKAILRGKLPGTYLIRFDPSLHDRLVVSYLDSHGNVKHCGLYNVPFGGIVARKKAFSLSNALRKSGSTNVTAKGNESPSRSFQFQDLVSFLKTTKLNAKPRIACPATASWNSFLEGLFHVDRAFVLNQDILPFDAENISSHFCNFECKTASLGSHAISVECEVCKVHRKEPGMSTPLAYPRSAPPSKTDPVQLDALLRKGAERFRMGHRSDAEYLFRQVLTCAEDNILYHLLCYEESPPAQARKSTGSMNTNNDASSSASRRRRSVIGTSSSTSTSPSAASEKVSLYHDSNSAWCKCISCISYRAMARAYGNVGHVLSDKKQVADAIEMYKASLPLLRELGMWKQEPIALSSLSTCAQALKDPQLAYTFGLEYLGTITQEGDRRILLAKLDALDALEIHGKVDAESVATFLHQGDVAFSTKSPLQALAPYGKALSGARCLNDDILEVNALVRLGCSLYCMHRLREAIVHFERAVVLLRNNNLSVVNRNQSRARVELHNLALSFAKQATGKAGWAVPK